jgi:glycosyltransferase involved in cell wall biosynthesis
MHSSFAPRVLLVLPQLPQDPAAGAARSLTTICEMLAASGFEVRALAVTASENPAATQAQPVLHGLGIEFSIERRKRPELRFTHRGIAFRLIDTSGLSPLKWPKIYGRHFDSAFDEELNTFQPDAIFTFGGSADDLRRHRRAQNSGAKVVFGLRNEGYLTDNDWHRYTNAILTPSRYLSNLYRERIGIESEPLPTPIELADVVADEHDPIFLTIVNPSPEKGVAVFARLAEELSNQRPDLPILVIESRGSAGLLAGFGENGGFDLRRHENIMFSPAVPTPKDVYLPTRILAVPSLMDAAPRVIAEALSNGIPPLVSNRGGLPEMADGAGFVFTVPDHITMADGVPVSAEVVAPWVETIIRLFDDEEFYRIECEKAKKAAERFSPKVLAPQYANFFRKIIAGQ